MLEYRPSLLDPWFILLLAGVASVRTFIPGRWLLAFGTAASVALIALSTRWQTAALGVATALAIVYPFARWIAGAKAQSDAARARLCVAIGITLIVALWVFVKVCREIGPDALQGTCTSQFLIATVGFSYFLFRAINYLWMHYLVGGSITGSQGPVRLVHYLLFPSTIEAGPIQKYLDFSKELDARRRLSFEDASLAIERITRGYFFSIVLGRLCYEARNAMLGVRAPAAPGEASPSIPGVYHAWESLGIFITNHFYLFFDFAGYSSVAIGFGMLLGIKVPENFRLPFLATTMAEFWRNWHITLGDWFRDHIFVPLGGMKSQGLYPAFLAALIMVLSGVWHGLSWVFITWGCWHALMIFMDAAMGLKPIPPADRRGAKYIARLAWTNGRVALGSLLFLPAARTNVPAILEGFGRWW